MERAFVVHRTMSDVRWIDPSIDPNGRKPNWCFLGDPRIANSAPAGLARYSSLRSWLSQWSYDKSNAKGPMNAALVKKTPVLQIVNQADDAVPATHNPAIRAALATHGQGVCRDRRRDPLLLEAAAAARRMHRGGDRLEPAQGPAR